MKLIATILSILMIGYASIGVVGADTVPEDQRIPIDLRRTTLVVRDMERSLEFYRDGLGLEVIYDQPINTPRDADDEVAEIVRRLVFLRSNDDYIGIIGLLEYKKPAKPHPPMPEPFGPGTIVLVFNTEDAKSRIERVRQIEGVVVSQEPVEVTYPSYDGTGTIPVMMSAVSDPDGHMIELNQFIDGTPERNAN